MTILNKFITRIIEEPTDSLGMPILHEIALKRKVSKAKLRKLTNVLHLFGLPKECYLRIHQCDTCKEDYGWRNAYHLELAYKGRLDNYFDKTKWIDFTVTKRERLSDNKIAFKIGIDRFKKLVKDFDIIDANITSDRTRNVYVFVNDDIEYVIDGSVVNG